MNFVNAVVSGTSADPDGSSRANGCVSANRLELHCISRELRVEPSHLILSPPVFISKLVSVLHSVCALRSQPP